MGNFIIGGFGPPNPIHKPMARLIRNAGKLDFSLVNGNSIPRVKRPSRGPPTIPKTVKLAWRTPLRYSATKLKAMARRPNKKAKSLDITAARLGDKEVLRQG